MIKKLIALLYEKRNYLDDEFLTLDSNTGFAIIKQLPYDTIVEHIDDEYLDSIYVRRDGTLPLTGNWDVGNKEILNINALTVNSLATAGKILFTDAAGKLTQDLNLHWDNTNKRLGIGIGTPAFDLDVAGKIAAMDRVVTNQIQARTTYGTIFTNSTGTKIGMHIDDDGRVGIGTTTPGATLDIDGVYFYWSGNNFLEWAPVGKQIYINGPAGLHLKASDAGGSIYIGEDANGNINLFSNASSGEAPWLVLYGYPSGASAIDYATFLITGANNDLKIQTHNVNGNILLNPTSGKVGIGTTSPSWQLTLENASAAEITLKQTTSGNTFNFLAFSNESRINAVSEVPLTFRTNNIERMRITGGGDVGIGGIIPEAKLDVGGSVVVRGKSEPTSGKVLRLSWDNTADENEILSFDYGTSTYKRLKVKANPICLNPYAEGNVGIGLSNPGEKLHIQYGDSQGMLIESTGTGKIGIKSGGSKTPIISNKDLQFGYVDDPDTGFYPTINVLYMDVDPGKIGIGTTTPDNLLHVYSATSSAYTHVQTNGTQTLAGIKLTGQHAGTSKTSEIYMDYYGSPYHGLNYKSGRPGLANHWFLEDDGTVQMVIKDGGYVGIGTSSPSSQLTLSTNDTSTTPQLTINQDSTGDASMRFLADSTGWSMGLDNSYVNAFMICNTTYGVDTSAKFTIRTDGKVGIGTTDPLALLDVNGIGAHGQGAAGAPSFTFRTDLDTGMWSSSGDTLNFSTGGSERMRIDGSGKVGIGTPSPSQKLDIVNGNLRVRHDTSFVALVLDSGQSGGTTWGLYSGHPAAGDFKIRGASSDVVIFSGTPTANSLVINSGKVGIGTYNPQGGLHIVASTMISERTGSGYGASWQFRNDGQLRWIMQESLTGGDSGDLIFRSCVGEYNDRLILLQNGKIGIGDISPTALLTINSDILRLKTPKTVTYSDDPGNQGDICWNSDYLYVCVANNSWRRIALSTFPGGP